MSAILMVTHDNRILDVADRVISMVDGHLEVKLQTCILSVVTIADIYDDIITKEFGG